MAEENGTETTVSNSQLKSTLLELVTELKGQKAELNSLWEEIRGNTPSVSIEVKKFKTD